MKKLIATIASCAVTGMLITTIGCSRWNQEGASDTTESDGTVTLTTREIPLPLGRYIEFADTEIPFSISDPDDNGNCELTAHLRFRILRHIPNLEYCTFKIEPKVWDDNGPNFDVKLKKDQRAVAKLAEAIAYGKSDFVDIDWKREYNGASQAEVEKAREGIDGQKVAVDNSTIYIQVPSSRVHIGGAFSSDCSTVKPATIHIKGDNNGIYLNLSCELYMISDMSIRFGTARIFTTDGNFEAVLNNPCFGTYVSGTTEYIEFADEKYYITPSQMDALLSSNVEIEIRFEGHSDLSQDAPEYYYGVEAAETTDSIAYK